MTSRTSLFLRTRWAAAAIAGAVLLAGAAAPGRAPAFCFDEAAGRYGLPADLLRIVAETESGMDPNAAGWNPDGSVDVGLMQVNSWWESRLGAQAWGAVCTDPCYNVTVGAWILAGCLERHGYTPEGIGCYNARSPEKRARYAGVILRAFLDRLGRSP